MQNDHKELWNLIDLVETGYLGSWEEFKQDTARAIKLGRYVALLENLILWRTCSMKVLRFYQKTKRSRSRNDCKMQQKSDITPRAFGQVTH